MVIVKITSAIKLVTEDGNYGEFYQPNDSFGVRVTILTQFLMASFLVITGPASRIFNKLKDAHVSQPKCKD